MNLDRKSSRWLLWLTAAAALVLTAILLVLFALVGHKDEASASAVDKKGPQVLLFRHALTDQSQSDADPKARGSCDQQRNLSAEGVAQAERIGEALQNLTITRVYASPFCRTLQTAEAMDVGPVQQTDALLSTTAAADADEQADILAAGQDLIDQAVQGAGVTVMVTHTQNIEALTGELVEEGDAVRLESHGDDVLSQRVVPAGDW
ncbi:hypothetical protein BH24ACT15_BH24ACT15_25140 [soil metagenome]